LGKQTLRAKPVTQTDVKNLENLKMMASEDRPMQSSVQFSNQQDIDILEVE